MILVSKKCNECADISLGSLRIGRQRQFRREDMIFLMFLLTYL